MEAWRKGERDGRGRARWMAGGMDRWMNGVVDGGLERCMDGGEEGETDGEKGRWMNCRMVGWM